jgi:hypothetical protein
MQRLEAIGIDPKFTKGKWKEKVGREGKWGKRKKKKKKKSYTRPSCEGNHLLSKLKI